MIMTPFSMEENWSQYKSVLNMLYFYRNELRSLISGKMITYVIPKGTRDRLVEQGVLRKFGSRFELTDQGKELLRKVEFGFIL
jgi:predicted transcriptional regulator